MGTKEKFNAKSFAIALIVVCVIIIATIYFLFNSKIFNPKHKIATEDNEQIPVQAEETKRTVKNEYALTDNDFSKFENNKKNIIYSPLSIKYAFKMLEEAATGESKEQLSSIVGGYELTKYKSNKNMALANAFFIRDS